jgi:hypothetical protein
MEEERYCFVVIDKTGKAAVRSMFGAIRKVAGEFYKAFTASVGVIP